MNLLSLASAFFPRISDADKETIQKSTPETVFVDHLLDLMLSTLDSQPQDDTLQLLANCLPMIADYVKLAMIKSPAGAYAMLDAINNLILNYLDDVKDGASEKA